MTNEHQSVEQLFEAALALPSEQRRAFVDRACSGSPILHHLMEQLIEAEGIPDSFLRTPVVQGQNGQHSLLPQMIDGPPRFGVEDVIAGRFRVVRFIARGGMGEVYEVQDQFLQGTPLALKIIRPHIAADPYSSRRFEQEVMLARRVNHRNLCPIYDIFHCDVPAPPFLFLTMKLLAGESLEARLKRHEEIPVAEAVQICVQLIEGIQAIHSVGIIHRDIKPNNVMLERSGTETCVTIMDFGLARLSEADATISRIGIVAGTPGYLAPELIRGASPSVASDLYALGIVLHQVLTGDRPVASKSGKIAAVSSALRLAKAPTGLDYVVPEFLSEDPDRRCAAFDRFRAEFASERTKLPVMTRRSFAVFSAAFLGLMGTGSIWKRREIDDYFHPLPAKRFVALLNWPPPSDAKATPMILGLIDTMVNALSRAEAFDHNFYVACRNSLTEMKTPAQVNDACESLGANLILATSGTLTESWITLVLKIIEKDSSKVLRSRILRITSKEQFSLSEMATHAAAQLLNVFPLPPNSLPDDPGTRNSNAMAAFQSAEAQMKKPNYSGLDAALEEYKLAIDADQRFTSAYARLSIAYYRRYTLHHDSAALMLARANAETALALDPDSVEGHSAMHFVYRATGDLPQALREISKALTPDPSNPQILIYQAQVYFELNRWQDTEESFKRVLRARPNYWYAYNGIANNYHFQGKYKLALQAYQAASVAEPRNIGPVIGIATMLFFLGELDLADAAVTRSLSLARFTLPLLVRADIMRVRKRFADSLTVALKAAEIDSEESTVWLRIGDAHAWIQHHEKDSIRAYVRGMTLVREELKIDPHDGSNWMLLALFQCKVGDYKNASVSLTSADAKSAIDIYSLMYKVRVLELLKRRNDALSIMATCIEMGATSTQIEATNDLKNLCSDARYRNFESTLLRSS